MWPGTTDRISVGRPPITQQSPYRFLDTTWAGYGGYPQAWQAPAAVQDAKAAEHVRGVLDANDGDVAVVPVV